MFATVLLLVPISAPPADPTITDKMVTAWVANLNNEDPTKQREAYQALMAAGPKAKSAVPALTKMLGAKDVRQDQIVDIFGAIGPDAKEAVPALLALLPKEPVGFGYGVEGIAVAVAKIDGPKLETTRALLLAQTKGGGIFLAVSGTLRNYPAQVIPQLVTLCSDKDAKVRANAASVIAGLKYKEIQKVPTKSLFEIAGNEATKGIPAALEKLLADESTDVRRAAANAITHTAPELTDKALAVVVALAEATAGKTKGEFYVYEIFYPVQEQAAKVLLPLLDHENDALRLWAIRHLTPLNVREPIEDALKNGKTARIRQGAAYALGGRYGTGVASEPALTAALKDDEFLVRFGAAEALVNVGRRESGSHAAAVPVLVEALQNKEEQLRIRASQLLLSTGPAAKDALPAMKKLLDDQKPAVRLEAALALVGIDVKEATGTVPALTEGLKAGDYPATRAAKALAALGPVAKDAVPELVKHFDAKSPHLRLYAAEAAARIDAAQAPKAVEVLVALLKDEKHKSSMVRVYSLNALQHIGPPAKPAMTTLADVLKDDGPFHTDAALAMIAIDPDGAKPAFEWMQKVLSKNLDDDAYELLEQLPNLGAKGKPLVPDLTELLKSKVLFYRKSAIAILAAIGPDAKDALPDLRALAVNDPRKEVRELADDAIKRIEKK